MKNKIEDLRDHLFETLENLKDGSVKLDTARAIVEVAQTLINSAVVEVSYLKVIENMTDKKEGSNFIPSNPRGPKKLEIAK